MIKTKKEEKVKLFIGIVMEKNEFDQMIIIYFI